MKPLPVLHSDDLASPKEPVGAVLTAGRRDNRGNIIPASKNRFWLGLAIGASKKRRRKLHPDFEAFNSTPDPPNGDAHPAASIRAVVMHADIRQAYVIQRRAHRGPANDQRVVNPQDNGSWCVGDGKVAHRWDGAAVRKIECPDERCPYAQGARPPCLVTITVHFFPRWDGTRWADANMPKVLTRWSSTGRNARDTWLGLIAMVRRQAEQIGVKIQSWDLMPFRMMLDFKTGPSGLYPVIQIATDGDLMSWLLAQRQQVAQLTGQPQPLGLLDPAAHTPDLQGDDAEATLEHVEPVRRPAHVAGPDDAPIEAEVIEHGEQVALFDTEAQDKATAALRKVGALDEFVEIHGPPDTWAAEDIAEARKAYKAAKKGGKS